LYTDNSFKLKIINKQDKKNSDNKFFKRLVIETNWLGNGGLFALIPLVTGAMFLYLMVAKFDYIPYITVPLVLVLFVLYVFLRDRSHA
ncbi:MAG: hypothetical protein KAR06_09830, partial [Deltaproteobacteria bacterium]|nr:hypothetical protein [Deltaproteobacteria bacterium]